MAGTQVSSVLCRVRGVPAPNFTVSKGILQYLKYRSLQDRELSGYMRYGKEHMDRKVPGICHNSV